MGCMGLCPKKNSLCVPAKPMFDLKGITSGVYKGRSLLHKEESVIKKWPFWSEHHLSHPFILCIWQCFAKSGIISFNLFSMLFQHSFPAIFCILCTFGSPIRWQHWAIFTLTRSSAVCCFTPSDADDTCNAAKITALDFLDFLSLAGN